MCSGIWSGPYFIFDQPEPLKGHFGQVFAVSAFSKFTAHNGEPKSDIGEIWFGLPGAIETLPKEGYDIQDRLQFCHFPCSDLFIRKFSNLKLISGQNA